MRYLTANSVFWSLTATLGLLAFYFLTMRILAGNWEAAFSQFEKLWFFMVSLSVGFGIQVGLYVQSKKALKNAGTTKVMAANTTASTVGMIACCAHHATDVLPIFGLSVLSVFLASYQIPILVAGIIFNIMGIAYHVNIARKIAVDNSYNQKKGGK